MKNVIKILLILLITMSAVNCSKNDDNSYPVRDKDVTLAQNDSVRVDLGIYSIEGGIEITQQARHYEKSELINNDYFYIPLTDFTGEDQVEISIYGSTGGDNLNPIGLLRITLIVETLED
jgi:hypothetical protein